jgi:hypothetical protein
VGLPAAKAGQSANAGTVSSASCRVKLLPSPGSLTTFNFLHQLAQPLANSQAQTRAGLTVGVDLIERVEQLLLLCQEIPTPESLTCHCTSVFASGATCVGAAPRGRCR